MIRQMIALVLAFGFLTGSVSARQKEINAAATPLAEDIAAASRRTVAVVDFTDLQGQVTELGRFIAEELSLGLVMARKNLSVVDRTHLKAILEENKLNTTGLIDPATARKLGKIAGVQALVTGTITPFPESVRVVIKVLDTETAQIIAASSIDLAKTQTIDTLVKSDIGGPAVRQPAAASSPSGQPPAVDPTPSAPSFQRGAIKATVAQLSVDAQGKRASLSITIENTSSETIYLALVGYMDPQMSLSDDRATRWQTARATGLPLIQNVDYRNYPNKSAYAEIGPHERMVEVLSFDNVSGTNQTGTTYNFSVQGALLRSSDVQGISIGLTGIRLGSK